MAKFFKISKEKEKEAHRKVCSHNNTHTHKKARSGMSTWTNLIKVWVLVRDGSQIDLAQGV